MPNNEKLDPKKLTNEQMFKAVLKEGTTPTVEKILKDCDLKDSKEVMQKLNQIPNAMNEFITTLVNRTVMTQFFNKVFENPLRLLHNGMMDYGTSIQQIFVEKGEKKGFQEHFDKENGSSEKDLIGKKVPVVHVDYITKNYEYKYKVTTSEAQVKQAFLNQYGVTNLVSALINSNLNGAYIDEYRDMKKILFNETAEETVASKIGKGYVYRLLENKEVRKTAIVPVGSDTKTLCKKIKAYANKFTLPSKKYNLSGIETWSNPQELIFITDSDTSADIDVDVLAMAFNVSHAEIKVRSIIVDELPQNLSHETETFGNVKGILMDKDLVQAWDIINTNRTFDNPEGLYSNHFLHKHGIMAGCDFAQFVVFTDKEI